MGTTCAKGHTFEESTGCPTYPTCERQRIEGEPFPKIGAPATRALASAGIANIAELAGWTERDLRALHGMGPKALGILRDRLAAEELTFRS